MFVRSALTAAAAALLISLPAAPGWAEPGMRITYLPPMGQCGTALGTTSGVAPADYYVAALIYIPGSGWWSKPFCEPRVVPVQPNNEWSAKICTGGIDNTAAIVEAYLIPKSSYPACYPACVLGAACVPQTIKDAAVACDRMLRPGQRKISWSGMDWLVKTGDLPVGPGPNYFSTSAENVWVDDQGRLHLRMTNRDGRWNCAEIYSEHKLGYGTYRVYLDGRVDDLDPNIVLGLFTWSDHTCEYAHREIDIEFSRWGVANDPNAQFVIQPWYTPGNRERFVMPGVSKSTHVFTWQPDQVRFGSFEEHCSDPTSCTVVHSWTYSKTSGIPLSGDERVHLNLWLREGLAPTNGQEREVVISRFEFEPFRGPGLPLRGISNRDANRPPADSANGLFRVWGKVLASDCRTFVLDDGSRDGGSAQPVRVLEAGHTLEPDDYAVAEGLLLAGGGVTTLDASAGRVWAIEAD